jgi:hypothetical protein
MSVSQDNLCRYYFCDCLSFGDIIYVANVLNDCNNKEELQLLDL